MIPVDILNYRLIRQLGAGGMGQVYLAQNKNIQQFVAIKALHPQYANNPALRQRFKQEAMMLSSLNHPNIVKFLNYVENEYGVFLIMEYVDGYTLEDFINKKNGLIVEKRAYPMLCEILDAFAYAHQRGIVHRDIKPSNIFINNEGHIKVMDFGIAQILSQVDQNSGQVMGTPEYMSPEQVFGHAVDQRSDIYSLGVLIHQMLTGRAPYDATTLSELEIKRRVINDTLPRMKDYYPYVSDEMQKIVDKATSKNVAMRFADCQEMKKAIKKVLDPDPIDRTKLYMGAGILAVVLLVGLAIWDYYRTKVYYYKDYAEYRGVPEGIYELSSREVSHRASSYRMEYSRHKLRRMTLVNSKGKPVGYSDTENTATRYIDTEFFYTDNGQIDYKIVYDQYGKLLFKLDYDQLKTASFQYNDEFGTAMPVGFNTTDFHRGYKAGQSGGTMSRYLLYYNDDTGLLEKMLYASGDGNVPVGDNDNIYGQAFEYDEKGRIVTVRYLGADGQPRNNHFGLGIRKFTYDDNDDWATVAYYSADGTPSHDGNNCSYVNLQYDKWGNRIAETYTTVDGKPSLRKDVGVFGYKYEYNDDGLRVKTTAVDGEGKPMVSKNRWTTEMLEYNADGYVTAYRFYGLDGEPVSYVDDGEAVSIYAFKLDDKGRELERAFYAPNGDLIELSAGYARVVLDYDSLGNVSRVDFYNRHGSLARYNGYNTSSTIVYDDFGREVARRYYDDKGNLTDCGDGTCGYDIVYDKQGNVKTYTCIGPDGKKPVRCNNAFAVQEKDYDDMGNNTRISYFDASHNPCLNRSGNHKIEYVYEPKNNLLTDIRYYDLSSLKYAQHYEYDANGNEVKEWATNAKGQLRDGTEVENSAYDKNNRLNHNWYTNLQGKMVNKTGKKYAQVKYKRDELGNVTEVVFLNAQGGAAADEDGAHKRIRQYDQAGQVIYEKNVDAAGKPTNGKNASPELKVEYDERGNRTAEMSLNGNGKPCINNRGYHKLVYTYDDHNNLTSLVYTDLNNTMVNPKDVTYAKVEYSYDNKGNQTSEKYYTKSNKLDYQVQTTYNERGLFTKAVLLNANGKQSDEKYGFSKITMEYQNDGTTPSRRRIYSASGQLLVTDKFNTKTQKWERM